MQVWDYVIVGAGSAGCVLANRLSVNPKKRVLLIEAGGSDRYLLQRIPAATVWLNLGNELRDWRLMTQPDPTRHDRVEIWSRGKMLGGSSSINGMIYVRGAGEDFDHWTQLGNAGWSYQDVLPLFQRLEDHELAHTDNPHREYYGHDGPVKIRAMRGAHELAHRFVDACAELGAPVNPHYNAASQEGACILSMTQSKRVRHSASQAFLEPIKHRRNLQIVINTQVTQIMLEGRTAVGVRTRDPEMREIRAGEVILSAGAIASPQLLLLSGIGPAPHLKDVGVLVRHDLPGVGQNLQDHLYCPVQARVKGPTLSMRPIPAINAALQWLFAGAGPLMSAGCQALAFMKTDSALVHPDVQIHMMPAAYERDARDRIQIRPSRMTFLANINHPRSRGMIQLASANPEAPPLIFPNLLADHRDVDALIAATRLGQRLLSTRALQPYVEEEQLPGQGVRTDQEWERFVRETAATSYHHCGTCKMGTDDLAVVDSELKVHGIDRLRVIDGSIMPTITSGNTNAACMMIGEKGAQLVRGTRH